MVLPTAADAFVVIDAVNRLNMAFDEWRVDDMVAAFTSDCVVRHPHGLVNGHTELRAFYDAYFPITVGVRRHNVNHVVDANDDGTITVTSHSVLVRITDSDAAASMDRAGITSHPADLPGIFTHATTRDRFRSDPVNGWLIMSRDVLDTVANSTLRPR